MEMEIRRLSDQEEERLRWLDCRVAITRFGMKVLVSADWYP